MRAMFNSNSKSQRRGGEKKRSTKPACSQETCTWVEHFLNNKNNLPNCSTRRNSAPPPPLPCVTSPHLLHPPLPYQKPEFRASLLFQEWGRGRGRGRGRRRGQGWSSRNRPELKFSFIPAVSCMHVCMCMWKRKRERERRRRREDPGCKSAYQCQWFC